MSVRLAPSSTTLQDGLHRKLLLLHVAAITVEPFARVINVNVQAKSNNGNSGRMMPKVAQPGNMTVVF